MDFDARQQSITQQRKIADALRKMGQEAQPEGSMVGGQFVAPNVLERLVPLFNAGQGAYATSKADAAQKQYDVDAATAAQQWRSALPQARAARPELQGPQAEGGSPELAAVPAQPITREAILKYTLEGMRNPTTRTEAGLVNTGLTADLQRGEDMQFKDEQARAASAERAAQKASELESRRAEIEMRLGDRSLDRAAREALAQQQMNLQRELAAMRQEGVRGASAAATRADETSRRMESREFRQNVENLSRRAEPITPMITAAQQIQDLLDASTDPKTGKMKNIPGVGFGTGSLPVAMLTQEGSNNRQKLQMFSNAMLRAQAGLSQTLTEQEKAMLEVLASGRFRQDQFVGAWPALMEKVNSTVKAINAGYEPGVVEEFGKRGGVLRLVGPKAKVAGPAASALSPEEEAELAALRGGAQ